MRERRHLGSRIIISTQEPTLQPKLLELSNVIFVHQFHSRKWFDAMKRHISIQSGRTGDNALFEQITKLRTGEAVVWAPEARMDTDEGTWGKGSSLYDIKIRERLTQDVKIPITALYLSCY